MDWHDKALSDWLRGETLQAIGDRYGVTRQAVHLVVRESEHWPRPRRQTSLEELLSRGLPAERPPDRCWEWQRSRTNRGYGRATASLNAHRVAWEVANGRPIPKGMQVLHSCDNPPCVNPAHLWLGTVKDNMADREAKGRGRYGPNRPSR